MDTIWHREQEERFIQLLGEMRRESVEFHGPQEMAIRPLGAARELHARTHDLCNQLLRTLQTAFPNEQLQADLNGREARHFTGDELFVRLYPLWRDALIAQGEERRYAEPAAFFYLLDWSRSLHHRADLAFSFRMRAGVTIAVGALAAGMTYMKITPGSLLRRSLFLDPVWIPLFGLIGVAFGGYKAKEGWDAFLLEEDRLPGLLEENALLWRGWWSDEMVQDETVGRIWVMGEEFPWFTPFGFRRDQEEALRELEYGGRGEEFLRSIL